MVLKSNLPAGDYRWFRALNITKQNLRLARLCFSEYASGLESQKKSLTTHASSIAFWNFSISLAIPKRKTKKWQSSGRGDAVSRCARSAYSKLSKAVDDYVPCFLTRGKKFQHTVLATPPVSVYKVHQRCSPKSFFCCYWFKFTLYCGKTTQNLRPNRLMA